MPPCLPRPEVPLPAAAAPPRAHAGPCDSTSTARDVLIDEFSTRGMVVLAPSTLGVPVELHEMIFAKRLASSSSMVNSIPEIIELLNAPGIVAALEVLGGPDYAIVPFCHAFFASGSTDQCWHKDDNVRFCFVRHTSSTLYSQPISSYPVGLLCRSGPVQRAMDATSPACAAGDVILSTTSHH